LEADIQSGLMEGLTVAPTLLKVKPNVPGVMTNEKKKKKPTKDFELNDELAEFYC
jgi:hypothetical protein